MKDRLILFFISCVTLVALVVSYRLSEDALAVIIALMLAAIIFVPIIVMLLLMMRRSHQQLHDQLLSRNDNPQPIFMIMQPDDARPKLEKRPRVYNYLDEDTEEYETMPQL